MAKAQFLADISAPSAGKSTDWYLANLAKKHGMKWATLDKTAQPSGARELVCLRRFAGSGCCEFGGDVKTLRFDANFTERTQINKISV